MPPRWPTCSTGTTPVSVSGPTLFPLDELVARAQGQAADRPFLLSPLDLQVIKAAGVTFAVSAIERVIEEAARGDIDAAAAVRGRLESRIGSGIRAVVPGSPEAEALKQALIEDGMWSQYLEVAIGPDAEIFTKSPVLSSVGWGADIGVRSDSIWNNPEPEVVLVVDRNGRPRGAALGNDVNLRDFEGRSALLLGKAKDNNASCAIGPFIRLFDDDFTMDDVRNAELELVIDGPEGYRLDRRQFDARDQPRSGGAGATGAQRASLSGRLRLVPRHPVRTGAGSRRARARLHPQAR